MSRTVSGVKNVEQQILGIRAYVSVGPLFIFIFIDKYVFEKECVETVDIKKEKIWFAANHGSTSANI